MSNELKWFAIVSLTMLASGSCNSIAIKGNRGQEMRTVKHWRERNDEAVVAYSTRVKSTLPEVNQDSGYYRGTVHQVEVDETESENRGSRMSFTNRKAKLEFDSKREIPGGPDAQHHSQKGI